MKYCMQCGQQLSEDAKFCSACGNKVGEVAPQVQPIQQPDISKPRKQFFDGEIHKCPNCGETLNSFSSNCLNCGYELRGGMAVNSVNKLSGMLNNATSEEQKISIIRNFPIPNTKEDILEFMFLASSNFDVQYYLEHINEEDISDAWLSKIKQCYSKAKATLSQQDFQQIESLYNQAINEIKKEKKKKGIGGILSIIGKIYIFVLIITLIFTALILLFL